MGARADRLVLATVKSFFGSRGVVADHVTGRGGTPAQQRLYASTPPWCPTRCSPQPPQPPTATAPEPTNRDPTLRRQVRSTRDPQPRKSKTRLARSSERRRRTRPRGSRRRGSHPRRRTGLDHPTLRLDQASQASIRDAAAQLRTEHERIDLHQQRGHARLLGTPSWEGGSRGTAGQRG